MTLPAFMQDLGDGIYAIDTAFQRDHFDAAYLIVEQGHAAFVDCGTNHAVPRLLAALAALGLTPAAVDWLIPTHVHLDHAGGAGLLMQALPQARLLVHPRGARHLVDPSALYQGALAVYGEAEMQRSYGTLLGVSEQRVQSSQDGQRILLAGRELLLLDTPGHARHHHCVWDARSGGWFTGDTFGLSYREFDAPDGRPWLLPTSTPVQFEPEALKASVARLLNVQPRAMFLTHFGRIGRDATEVRALAQSLLTLVDAMVAAALAAQGQPDRHAALRAALLQLYQDSARRHGSPLSPAQMAALLAMDVELNAQGLGIWLDKRTTAA